MIKGFNVIWCVREVYLT